MSTADELNRIRKEVIKGSCKNPDVTVIPASDLQRIKMEAKIQTAAEREATQKIANEQAELQHATAKTKQKKMKELEEERLRLAPPLSDLEKEDLEKASALRKRAAELHNENRDEVKHMNQLVG